MIIHMKADKACKVEILVVLDCELALDLSFEREVGEKWKILSLKMGAECLLMNWSGWLNGRLMNGPCPLGNQCL